MVKVPLPRWRMPLGNAFPCRTVTKGEPAAAALDCASRCQSNDSPSGFLDTISWYVLGSRAFEPGPQVQEFSLHDVAGRLVTASTTPRVQAVAPFTEKTNPTVARYQSELDTARSCCNWPDAPLDACESLGLPMRTELLFGIASRAWIWRSWAPPQAQAATREIARSLRIRVPSCFARLTPASAN